MLSTIRRCWFPRLAPPMWKQFLLDPHMKRHVRRCPCSPGAAARSSRPGRPRRDRTPRRASRDPDSSIAHVARRRTGTRRFGLTAAEEVDRPCGVGRVGGGEVAAHRVDLLVGARRRVDLREKLRRMLHAGIASSSATASARLSSFALPPAGDGLRSSPRSRGTERPARDIHESPTTRLRARALDRSASAPASRRGRTERSHDRPSGGAVRRALASSLMRRRWRRRRSVSAR